MEFFQDLLGKADSNVVDCDEDLLKGLLARGIGEEMKVKLLDLVTDSEIQEAIFSIGSDKSSGLDGFNSYFYKKAWSIVEGDFKSAIRFFFKEKKLILAFNSTLVALVPKSSNINSMDDFRPISCCSMVYKTITKIIANRMQVVLPEIILKNQSAFIKGISITDNILLA